MVDTQQEIDSVVAVVDLHALTVTHDPARVRAPTLEAATLLLAAGVDPETSLLYVQSHVPEHTELHYLLECATGYGEAHRMIQFKEKSGTHTRLSLLTYPVLRAADILLHDADEVVQTLRPIQERYAALAADPGYVREVLAAGAGRARSRCASTVGLAKEAFGLLTHAA
jgi:tryptophanyl-tRNA synthetase